MQDLLKSLILSLFGYSQYHWKFTEWLDWSGHMLTKNRDVWWWRWSKTPSHNCDTRSEIQSMMTTFGRWKIWLRGFDTQLLIDLNQNRWNVIDVFLFRLFCQQYIIAKCHKLPIGQDQLQLVTINGLVKLFAFNAHIFPSKYKYLVPLVSSFSKAVLPVPQHTIFLTLIFH